jgi:hypothetical protein
MSLTSLISCKTNSDTRTPEKFGEKVFNAIKSRDFETYKNFFVNKEDYYILVEKSTWDEEKKKSLLRDANDNLKSILNKIKPSFDKIIEDGENAGITWKETKFRNVEYEIRKDKNVELKGSIRNLV